MKTSDIVVLGAGPGGAATALRLSYLGVPCMLVDKATFPRDKICGDALSGKVTTLLKRLDPEILQRFNERAIQVDIWGIRFLAPNGRAVEVPFQTQYVRDAASAPGYVSKRLDFDNFLIEEVQRREDIDLHLGLEITEFTRTENGWQLCSSDGEVVISCRLLIVADGTQSSFSRKIAGLKKDQAHYAAALRAYYHNVSGTEGDEFIELHFLRELTPGYFWIFPLPDGQANVGLGMRSDIVAKKGINLKKVLTEIIEKHPTISPRFAQAEPIGKVYGYGLPLGSKTRRLSGDHYLLVGDAAHLIDPLTGEGIGNAMYSGFIAAELVEQCYHQHDYLANRLQAYDTRVARVLYTEMKLSYRLQKIMSYPWLVNLLGSIITSNQRLLHLLSETYTNFDLRKQLAKPGFWLRMLLRRARP